MQIGILITNIGDAGKKGFYNIQEIGLARAVDQIADSVLVYQLVPIDAGERIELIEGCHNAYVKTIPAHRLGTNGIFDVRVLEPSLDALIYFSDMQLIVPRVYHWSLKNNVRFLPYIGVLKSHSTNMLKRNLKELVCKRVLGIYRQNGCLAKTPGVAEELCNAGVKDVTIVPVGLDTYIADHEYLRYDKVDLKRQYGYREKEKVILFVGRLTKEKRPIQMLEIYDKLRQQTDAYRLLMIGTGILKKQVDEFIVKHSLCNFVKQIEKIENKQMYRLYRLADVLVNLNQQEIFGMSILEAMYYECKVVAWSAPGPDLLIENGISGWIVQNEEQVIKSILDETEVTRNAHTRVEKEFTWNKAAAKIDKIIRGDL